MISAPNSVHNTALPPTLKSVTYAASDKPSKSPPPQELSSILLRLGQNPSVNLISILEFGPNFLGCTHLNYTNVGEELETPQPHEEAIEIILTGYQKKLTLYGFFGEPDSENLKIFTALLTQQESRLRDIVRVKSLKDYTKKLFEACPDGIVVTDAYGVIINSNRAMVAITRKPEESLVGLKVSNLLTREGLSSAFLAYRKLKKQPRSRFDCRLNVGAGRTIPVSISFSDFHFQEQQLILATVRDLSYLEEEANKCDTYEQSLAKSIEKATDGFVRYDQFGRITDVNPYLEKLTGVYEARLIGRPVDDLLSVSSLRNFRKAVARLNENGYASFSCAINNSHNSEIPAHGTLTQFEVNGERHCRLMLQEQRNLAPLGSS